MSGPALMYVRACIKPMIALLAVLVVSACGEKTYELRGTPLTVRAPRGFEPMDMSSNYPTLMFQPARAPGDEMNRYPYMSIDRMSAFDVGDLDDIVKKRLTRGMVFKTLMSPHEIAISNTRAIEYGEESEVEYITLTAPKGGESAMHTSGGSGVSYEIVFERDGFGYECEMRAGPDDYEHYILVFEDFCSSVIFKD